MKAKVIHSEHSKSVLSSKVDDSFESLLYCALNVFAFSKFCDAVFDLSKNKNDQIHESLKNLHKKFTENKGFFCGDKEKELYEKIILIIDKFCDDKLEKFIIFNSLNKDNLIDDFLNDNFISLKVVKNEISKHKNIFSFEFLIKSLFEKDPQKFNELIDFEINRKELKEARDKVRFVMGDTKTQPATVFLNEIRKHSNLQDSSSKNKNSHSFCVVS